MQVQMGYSERQVVRSALEKATLPCTEPEGRGISQRRRWPSPRYRTINNLPVWHKVRKSETFRRCNFCTMSRAICRCIFFGRNFVGQSSLLRLYRAGIGVRRELRFTSPVSLRAAGVGVGNRATVKTRVSNEHSLNPPPNKPGH